MTAEQQARDMLKRMGVEDAQSFSAGDLAELANLIAERNHLLAMLNFIGTADPGGCELFPVGPAKTEFAEDGNTILRHVGPWRFLDGKGDTFLAAIEDSMRQANAGAVRSAQRISHEQPVMQRLTGGSMNDKELLEAAARAAGIVCSWAHEDEADYSAKTEGMWLNGARSPDNSKFWNPLTDDGDALRLAVKLKMDVKQWESNSIAVAVWDKHATEDATQDRYNATRRAIVRAAAAIGSSHNAEVKGDTT